MKMTPPLRKAIVLTAGLGTRFLPMTKGIPKAMLPIVDKPVLQYLIEEASTCGIKEIIVVTGLEKRVIENYFSKDKEFEAVLTEKGKLELIQSVRDLTEKVDITYLHQENPHGDGHAILCAKEFIGDEPFAVLFGDDIIDNDKPALLQLLEVYQEKVTPVICTEHVPKERIHLYGVIEPKSIKGRILEVKGLVEKPNKKDAPSNYGIIGKYICTPEVLSALEECESSHGGEIRLIDGFRTMLEQGKSLHALEAKGTRYDTGNRAGLLKANIAFALKEPELKEEIQSFLDQL